MIPLNKFEFLGCFCPIATWMIRYDCLIGVLLAVMDIEGWEQFGNCLDFGEVFDDFSIFEKIIKQYE